MKKRMFFIFMLFLLSCKNSEVFAQDPLSIAYHANPSSPVMDFLQEPVQFASNILSMKNQVMQMYQQAASDASNMQSAVTSQFDNIKSGAVLSLDANPGQDAMTYCGKDLSSVKPRNLIKEMKNAFMLYDSPKNADIAKKQKIRQDFYIDNIYAIHAAAIAVQSQLNEEGAESIKTKIEKAKLCAEGKGDICGTPATDDGGLNEVLFAYGQTLETLDSLVRMWESVAALKARLKAVEELMRLEPAIATQSEKSNAAESSSQQGALEPVPFVPVKTFAEIRNSEALAFAQVMVKKETAALPKSTAETMNALEAKVSGTKSESLQLIGKTLDFAKPDETQKDHPLVEAEEKLQAYAGLSSVEQDVNAAMSVHNMMYELKSYKEMADQYAEMKKDYEKALQKLQVSDQCAIKYLSNYFSNPVKVWSGVNLNKNVNAHNLRKGISGWAVEAYETAKAAETSVITTDDVALVSVDDKDLDDLADDPDLKKNEKRGMAINVQVTASKQEQAQAENRKSDLKPWEIGAEAAKMLGADVSAWGTPSGKKMIWTDTKNFYQQYLRRKYDNVKSYLKAYTRNDVLALVVARLKGQKQDINETNYQKKIQEAQSASSKQIIASMQKAVSAVSQEALKNKSAASGLQKQREALIAKMDKLSLSVKDGSDKISDIRAVAEEKAADKINETVNAKVVFPPVNTVINKIFGSDKLSEAIKKSQTEETDTKKIASLEKQMKTDRKKLDSYKNQLEKLDSQIAEAKLAAQEKSPETLNQGASAVEKIQKKLEESIKLNDESYASDVRKNMMAILSKSALANPLLNPAVMMAAAEEAADISLKNLYAQVDNIIDGGYQQMLALGDDLYKPEAQVRLMEIHNAMINQVKGLMLSYSVAGLINIKDIIVYAKLETADVSPETEGFFVGATAKARDLKAPYAIPDFNLPPVREVFHFDGDDFAVIKPKVKGRKNSGRSLSASDFLNYGGEIPAIWQYMLKDNAFIESRFNLKEALNYGCTDVAFARGGIMPCVVDGSSVILDVNSKGEYLRRSDLNASSLPKCLLVTTKKGRPYHTFWDVPVVFASPVSGLLSKIKGQISDKDIKPAARGCAYSELGMLLDADENNNLKFKELAFEVYNNLLDDTDTNKLSDKQKNKIAAAQHASLMRNQIGDFLRQAENEKLMRENLEEYKQKYDQQMEELKNMLREYGFEPAASFDLSKDSDYNLAVNKLRSIRDKQMSKSSSAISKTPQKDNPMVEEKVGNLNKIMSAMKSDKDALRKVSVVTSDENNTAAELKKAKADAAVVDKYKKGLKEGVKDYNDMQEPYCANY